MNKLQFFCICAAILADEMGLGKTIQAITYLTLLKHLKNDPGPHLIVCPASLLENWERELKKWCPSFSVLQYHGAGRAAYSKELSYLSKAGLPPPFNVLLVCYSLFERHSVQQKDDRKILKRWRWSCVLMDEAHAMKDKNSYRWKNLKSVARNAKQRLMLTGTPLQNDLHELWSMLEFMMPGLFATEDVDLKKLLNAEDRRLVGRMKSILGPFILRRLKSDVMQQLVPKIQRVEYVIMEKQQENAYREAIEEYRTISRARIAKLSECDLNNIVRIIPQRQISNYFVQFRKIANHPLLVRRIYDDDDVVQFAERLHSMGVFECTLNRVVEELKNYSDFSIHQLLLHYGITGGKGTLSDEHVMLSAKCQVLAELLPSLKRSGHRVLIFSQWTSMLDILEWTLDVIGVTYRRLDGSTQVTDRQTIVDDFNNDTSIFACLLSTRAGGQGLNLTGADTVVIHDMDFNPQKDRQAEDRCHRIGQTRPVTIYRLVTKGTVDENVYEIAKRKLTLDAAVLESGIDVGDEDDTSEKTMGQILSSLLMS
ncbi:CHROMATIN REMODELING 19 [Hibiscus trionum]|uniref:CHROMATIN REMODELING 19 n=2 Tax=Hibiscus trionum TaxID=183268 RepID=A0A9W7HD09_HIBTR|nr:CHROMATIN REMODELING 19 [Hibiscus trionum]